MRSVFTGVRGMILLLAGFLVADGNALLAGGLPPPICSEVCNGSPSCGETCYIDMMEFENGNDITCGDYGVSCCGDSYCETEGEQNSCEEDCGSMPPNPTTCGTCNPVTQAGCSTGYLCGPDCECHDIDGPPEPSPPPACFVPVCTQWGNECCAGNFCYTEQGWGSGVCIPTQ